MIGRRDTRVTSVQGAFRLQYFSHQHDGQWGEDSELVQLLKWFSGDAGSAESGDAGTDSKASDNPTEVTKYGKALRDMLYGVENLRKRPGAED